MTRFLLISSLLLIYPRTLWAQLIVEPQNPAWGETITVFADPRIPIPDGARRFHRGDRSWVALDTLHDGNPRRQMVEMKWDGTRFMAQIVVPDGCQWAAVSLYTSEKHINLSRRFVPLTREGTVPQGGRSTGMNRGAWPRSHWKQDIDLDLLPGGEMGWVYQEIWGLRFIAMRNLSHEELVSEIRLVETRSETPGLLRSLAYGYFLAGDPQKGFEKLELLCRKYPESAEAVFALHDADYQVFSRNWNEYDTQLKRLRAEVVNRAPENQAWWNDEVNALNYLTSTPGITVETLRKLCSLWMEAQPESMQPHLALAITLAREHPDSEEAESLADRAIELAYVPRPSLLGRYHLGLSYRLRSSLRAERGDLVGALADSQLAQHFSRDQDTEALEAEAKLWERLGFPDRAEQTGMEAYRKGSLEAEALLQELYANRTGSKEGFRDHFLRELTGEKPATEILAVAPAFRAATLDLTIVDTSSLKGSIVALNFWFINCGPCLGEMPKLNEIVDRFKNRVRFLAFALDGREDLMKFRGENTFKYEIIPDGGKVSSAYNVESYPTHFIIDRAGRIVWEARGANPENLLKLEAMLERMLR